METLIMATNNAHKLREIRQILGEAYEVKGLADIGCHEDIPETADTLEGNALQKARYVHEHYGLDCFADDTGLEVEALDGAPGIYTARWGQMNGYGDSHDTEANIDCLIDKMQGKANRRARFRTAIALVKDGKEHLFEGIVEGEVLTQRTGGEGFGYDPIFAPVEGEGKSFAEMGPEGKNAISHRARATQRLVEFLRRGMAMLFLVLLPLFANATRIGEWQLYRSYHQATQCALAGNMIYVNYAGNLLSYDTEDHEVRTFDSLHDLNGITITHLHYSPAAKRLVIAYDDCGIDLMDVTGHVVHLSSLKNKDVSGKSIQSITIDGSMAYLATEFGMVEMDVAEGVFRSTYQLQRAVHMAARMGDAYYLATDDGLLCGKLSDNLHESSAWQPVASGKWTALYSVGNQFVGLVNSKVTLYTPNQGMRTLGNAATDRILPTSQGLLWTSNDKTYLYPSDGSSVRSLQVEGRQQTWLSALTKGKTLWVCEGDAGLTSYAIKDDTYQRSGSPLQLNSPTRDLSYRLQWCGDRLLVSGGRNDAEVGFISPLSMMYEGGKWTMLQEMVRPVDKHTAYLRNTTHLVQDPSDNTHHFASLYRTGLCEYRNGKFVKLYDSSNSKLTSILPDDPNYYVYVSCSGAKYDMEGNLWMLGSMTNDIVKVMAADGKWYSLHYDEIALASLCDDYLFHSSGIKFINSRWVNNRGFFAFDTNGTLNTTKDDRHRLHATITNQDGTSYTPDNFYCMTEDLDGRIWCGTSAGLFVINDADEFFNNDFRFEQVKVARNDGSGLADYLLSGISITCVAIDGANRKWIGTLANGIYLISADGQEMLHHFTTTNSPILSNNVNDIAIHPTTGVVMIATDKGLCSYASDATQALADLDEDNVLVYPNPVKPDHTGPIVIKGLTMASEVKVLSASGQLVWQGVSNGGMCTWNGCNKQGTRVASGVYHVVANTSDGEKAIVARIVVIR